MYQKLWVKQPDSEWDIRHKFELFLRIGWSSILVISSGKIHFRNTIEQVKKLGTDSIGIVGFTTWFVGMVFAVQLIKEFVRFGAGAMIGGVTGLALWRELAPLMTAIVVAGRIGSAIAAELGTMQVTEQIDALESMAQDPIQFLVVPRIIAVTFMLPLLVGLADIVSFLGGFTVVLLSGKLNPVAYFESAQTMLTVHDIMGGLIKGIAFGLTISWIATAQGLSAKSGARGVGQVTINSVVLSLASIFVLNYLLSLVLF